MSPPTLADRIESKADEMERELAALRKLAEVATELGEDGVTQLLALVSPDHTNGNGHSNGNVVADPKAPRGREAIMRVVAERPGLWTLSEIVDGLKASHWFTSRKAAEVAVSRLCASGALQRKRKGVYEFSDGKEGAGESERSDGAKIPFSFEL